MNTFGDRLKYLRKLKNWRQEDLAEKLDVSGSAIGGYERGIREPSLELIGKIAKELDVSADYLLGVEEALKDSKDYEMTDLREMDWNEPDNFELEIHLIE